MKKQELKAIRSELQNLHERLAIHIQECPLITTGNLERDYLSLIEDCANDSFYKAASAIHRLWVQAE